MNTEASAWHAAGEAAYRAYDSLSNAGTAVAQADATVRLANAMSDLASRLPGWDETRGELTDVATESGPDWHDAASAAYCAWAQFAAARTFGMQASYWVAFSNAMSDLVSFLPNWDWERGALNENSDSSS